MSSGNPIIDAYWRHTDAGKTIVECHLRGIGTPIGDFIPREFAEFTFSDETQANEPLPAITADEFRRIKHEAEVFLSQRDIKMGTD